MSGGTMGRAMRRLLVLWRFTVHSDASGDLENAVPIPSPASSIGAMPKKGRISRRQQQQASTPTSAPSDSPSIPSAMAESMYMYCGRSEMEAYDNCWRQTMACRGPGSCPEGQTCYWLNTSGEANGQWCTRPPTPGPSPVVDIMPPSPVVADSKHWYCGETESQAYSNCWSQTLACPDGGETCPEGLDCFALNTSWELGGEWVEWCTIPPSPAPTSSSYWPHVAPFPTELSNKYWYCGETEREAYSNCWDQTMSCPNGGYQCPNGLDCFELNTSWEAGGQWCTVPPSPAPYGYWPPVASPVGGRQTSNPTVNWEGVGEDQMLWWTRDLLIKFFVNMNGPDWLRSNNWESDEDMCSWYGIVCDQTKNVINITLPSNELQGTADVIELFIDLPSLSHLDLSGNRLEGTLSEAIGGMKRLRSLDLSFNTIKGEIPQIMSFLPELVSLDLSYNILSGYMIAFQDNPKLRLLNLSGNSLIGRIPPLFLDVSFAEAINTNARFEVDLSHNMLEGEVAAYPAANLNLNVVGNNLTDINDRACQMLDWNNGDVGLFGCDGIACSVGSANAEGRQTSLANNCKDCETAFYIGTQGCGELSSPGFTNITRTSTPTARPSPSPVVLKNTFSMYSLPTFIIVLIFDSDVEEESISLQEMEVLSEDFLSNAVEKKIDSEANMFITTTTATLADPDDVSFEGSDWRSSSSNIAFVEIGGVTAVRDGLFTKENVTQVFLPSYLNSALRTKNYLLEALQESETNLREVSDIEVSKGMNLCPSGLRCHNGAVCVRDPSADETYYCDCGPTTTREFEVFAGNQCEYFASSFCSNSATVAVYAFCTNEGRCRRTNTTSGEPPPGCWCPDGFDGDHCEIKTEEVEPPLVSAGRENGRSHYWKVMWIIPLYQIYLYFWSW